MAWKDEKNGQDTDLVWSGAEFGIASSPLSGTANIQNANISTQTGEAMASFGRVAQQQATITGGTLNPDGSINFTGPATLKAGTWIEVTSSTVTSISTTTTPTTASVEYLAAGGGGGGGGATSLGTNFDASGGGGGAGEVETGSTALALGNYSVIIGNGGTGGASNGSRGTSGQNTTIGSSITALGGGGGGGSNSAEDDGLSGGSGGGGGGEASLVTSGTGGTGTAGFNGGAGSSSGEGGGGGGAGAVGGAAPGNGGIGTSSSISGTSVFYGGGGGGGDAGGTSPNPGEGGQGGGGNGGSTTGTGSPEQATAGQANTGGGGGGGGATDNIDMAGANGGSGIAIIRYVTGTLLATGGTVTYSGIYTIHTFTSSDTFRVLFIPKANQYYVSYASGTTFKLSSKFDPTGANPLTHGTTGTVTFNTVAVPNLGVAKAVEKYTTATNTEYRYYILDANSRVWVYDTLINQLYGTQWMLPDPNDYSFQYLTGIAVINGILLTVGVGFIFGKPTVDLGKINTVLTNVFLNEPFPTHTNFAMAGQQGKMYYCDGNYIGEVFPTTSLITSIANIQSYCSYTASTTTGTISAIIAGALPYSPDGTRIPVVFFTDVYGTQPTNLTPGRVYYCDYDPVGGTFKVYLSLTDTVEIDMVTGAAGNQYFTTFWPFGSISGVNGSSPTVQFSGQRVNLPSNETAQCLVEIGNTVLIGGRTNTVYPWNQVDSVPSDFIALPEENVSSMINVNNIAYIFAGNKGNIYITNGSQASLTLKVPDYVAGVPGDVDSYVEPYFTWGDSMYCRGRVYFSILDQTADKAGNCGGVWSFVPIQNIDPNQQIGMALRLENQNSYGTYNGYATILIPAVDQKAISPQYWSAWQNGISTPSYGIDFTSENPVTQYVVETDILMTGTMLHKKTFKQVEYKLTTPLLTNDSISIQYRLNSTSAWTALTDIKDEPSKLSGYFNLPFQKTEWVQFRIVGNTGGTTTSSFTRLKEIRLR